MADVECKLENARIVFRNFSGREEKYNEAGKRNFSVVLDDRLAEAMRRDNWAVKSKPPREEGDDMFHHLPVKVNFKSRQPPLIVLVSSRGQTELDESTCGLLDIADIKFVDLILNQYPWDVNGNTGYKAYLKTIYVIINEDALQLKYAEVPDLGPRDEGD